MIQPRRILNTFSRTPPDPESHHPFLRLDRNERVIPFPEPVLARFRELLTADAIMTYPEPEPLYRQLAKRLQVERDHLLFTHGSDMAIRSVYETYIEPGDRVQIHLPCYAMHEIYGRLYQAQLRTFPYNRALELDTTAYVEAIDDRTRMVLLENPNGFIGTIQSAETVRAIVKRAHQCNALAVLDEAYYLFSDQTVQPLYREFDNVIIVRTFSKDLGIAGLRCGYLLAQPHLIQWMARVKPVHEINSAAVAFALASLEYPDLISAYVKETQASLRFVRDELTLMGLAVVGGDANFVVVYLGAQTDLPLAIRRLKDHGILIRRVFQLDEMKGWIRVGAGTLDHMRQFVAVLRDVLQEIGWRREDYRSPVNPVSRGGCS